MCSKKFEALKDAELKIYYVRSSCILGNYLHNDSLGIAFMPPQSAHRLNIYSEEGSTVLNNKPLEFYFNFCSQMIPTDEFIDSIHLDIMNIATQNKNWPSICIFISEAVGKKLLPLLKTHPSIEVWDSKEISEENKLFYLYLNDEGKPRVAALHPNQILTIN